MSKQVSFDIFAGLLYKLYDHVFKKYGLPTYIDVKWVISVLSAFFASILACLSSQPGDMILTGSYRSKTHAGTLSIIHDIYKKHGLSGFFLGLKARLAHVATIITSQLVLYDMIKILLGLPITGSH
jgi:solute carrier family 25 phosphate transporter 3